MNKAALAFFLVASLGLSCNDSGLRSHNAGTGGQTSTTTSGGSFGFGGAGTGGSAAGGTGGSHLNSGGSAAGGTIGTGGTTPDAGAGKDSATDAACLPLPCGPLPLCGPGYQTVYPPCGCPTCVPVDAGTRDAIICPPMACPAIACANGTLPNPDPCGCPLCAPPDAGADTATCKNLDECACLSSAACAPIAEACYCPYPQCGSNRACICGGGKYLGCAAAGLATCAGAKAQLAALCPTLKGPTFDGLCGGTNSACVTKCLGEVTSCSDVSCTFCEACDCSGDHFSQCLGKCTLDTTRG